MLNTFSGANSHLTHAQIVGEYEDKVRALERRNERLIADNERLQVKVDNARYFINSRIFSLNDSLQREPSKIKQAQLELCRAVQEELK